MSVIFERRELIRFGHCDPAGIVFYPRYFELLNALVEDWFSQGLGVDYHQLIGERRVGLPTVTLETEFRRVSRMGERLRQCIAIERLGRSSLTLRIRFLGQGGDAGGDDDLRVAFRQVLVCTSLDTHQSQRFPDDVRAALEALAPPDVQAPPRSTP